MASLNMTHFVIFFLTATVVLFAGRPVARASESCSPSPEWVAGTVTVGEQPVGVAVDPATSRAFVLNRGNGTISVLDTQSLATVETWDTGPDPVALAASSNLRGPSVYVIRRHDARSTFLTLDGRTGGVKRSKELEIVAADIATGPSGGLVYVVGWDGSLTAGGESSNGAIVALDGTTGQITAMRLFGGLFFRLTTVAVEPTGGKVFVRWTARYGHNGIEMFEGIQLDRLGALNPYGDNGFSGLAFDANGRRLFLSTTWKWVNVVDLDLPPVRPGVRTDSDVLLGQVDAGRPGPMVYDEGTKLLYVSRWPFQTPDSASQELIVVDTRSLQVLGSLPVGSGAHRLAVDPATHRVFVTNSSDGTVTVVQGVIPNDGC